MSAFTRISVSTLALLTATGPLAADITGAEVWANWRDYMQTFGYEVTGDEARSGNTLTVSDLTMSLDLPQDEGSVSINMNSVAFVDNADGSVSITLPSETPVQFDMTPQGDEDIQGTLFLRQTDPTLTATGTIDKLTYAYAAERAELDLGGVVVSGTELPQDALSINIGMADIGLVTRVQNEGARLYEQEATIPELTYDLAVTIPEEDGGGGGRFSGVIEKLSLDGVGTVPENNGALNAGDMAALIEAGFGATGNYAFAAGESTFHIDTANGRAVGNTLSNGGHLDFSMSSDGLVYEGTQHDMEISMQMPGFPLPVSLAIAEFGGGVTMPLTTGGDPQNFALSYIMRDFTLSDTIWGLFDPAGQLPRDPATLEIVLAGTARMLLNLMDPEDAQKMERGEAPGELRSLDIGALRLSAVGAEVAGEGSFTFDNTDLETFGGMPRPEGALDIRLSGANALMDRLVQMGVLPQEQSMAARMMLGLFTVPESPDVLTSKIEINGDGHVLANGQRIQ